MTTTAPPSAAWQEGAACAGQDTELWFPNRSDGSTAVNICRCCLVRAECLYDALQHETPSARYGIWGGLTTDERHRIPALSRSKPAAIAALREVLDTFAPADPPLAERTHQPMTSTPPTPVPAAEPPRPDMVTSVLPAAEQLPVGKLLKWGDEHPDADVRDQAARARAVLAGLRQRHAADQELTAITTEAEQLEKRLAELRAREAELVPAKPKRKTPSRDYDTRTVRAWAVEQGVECPRVGQIPRRVLDAWRASASQAG